MKPRVFPTYVGQTRNSNIKVSQEQKVQKYTKNKKEGLRNTDQSRPPHKKRPHKKHNRAIPPRHERQAVAGGACPIGNVPPLVLQPCSHPIPSSCNFLQGGESGYLRGVPRAPAPPLATLPTSAVLLNCCNSQCSPHRAVGFMLHEGLVSCCVPRQR